MCTTVFIYVKLFKRTIIIRRKVFNLNPSNSLSQFTIRIHLIGFQIKYYSHSIQKYLFDEDQLFNMKNKKTTPALYG